MAGAQQDCNHIWAQQVNMCGGLYSRLWLWGPLLNWLCQTTADGQQLDDVFWLLLQPEDAATTESAKQQANQHGRACSLHRTARALPVTQRHFSTRGKRFNTSPCSAQQVVRREVLVQIVVKLHAYDQHASAHDDSMLALLAAIAVKYFTAPYIAS